MTRSRFLGASMFIIMTLAFVASLVVTLSADVGDVTVTAKPESFAGQCPATIKFTGTIQVLSYPMSFNYHWERSDGVKGEVRVVHVPNAKTRTVTVVDYWRVGSKGKNLEVWEKLHVNCGNTHIVGGPASSSINCQ
jgi:hypothetical protein